MYFCFLKIKFKGRRWRQALRLYWWRTPCCRPPEKMIPAWCFLILHRFPNTLQLQLQHHPRCLRTPSLSQPCRSCRSWTMSWCIMTILLLGTITHIKSWIPHVAINGENLLDLLQRSHKILVKQGNFLNNPQNISWNILNFQSGYFNFRVSPE